MSQSGSHALQIGLLGGTFDPIHFGHLNLAIEVMERRGLDEVWFCPAYLNPHKKDREVTSVEHREKMVQLAIDGIPQFRLLDIESQRKGISYTVDTLRELTKLEKGKQVQREFSLILSNELLPDFLSWREPEEIVGLASLIIGSRNESFLNIPNEIQSYPKISQAIMDGWTETPLFDISSTNIRNRLAKGLCCEHLLPKIVLDYISQNQLYFTN